MKKEHNKIKKKSGEPNRIQKDLLYILHVILYLFLMGSTNATTQRSRRHTRTNTRRVRRPGSRHVRTRSWYQFVNKSKWEALFSKTTFLPLAAFTSPITIASRYKQEARRAWTSPPRPLDSIDRQERAEASHEQRRRLVAMGLQVRILAALY